MPKSFKTELLEAWDAIREARKGQVLRLSDILFIAGEMAQVVDRLVGQLQGDDEGFHQLVLDCEWLVAEYVVKPDMPFVNDTIERYVLDPSLVPMVRPALLSIREKRV